MEPLELSYAAGEKNSLAMPMKAESICLLWDPAFHFWALSNRNECLGPLIDICLGYSRASLIAQLGKTLPSMKEPWV